MSFSAVKDPDATLDYLFDWEAFLSGDRIADVVWVVPAGIVQESATNTTTSATIWLSGGTTGSSYAVVCRISTTEGRTDDRTLKITVLDR